MSINQWSKVMEQSAVWDPEYGESQPDQIDIKNLSQK